MRRLVLTVILSVLASCEFRKESQQQGESADTPSCSAMVRRGETRLKVAIGGHITDGGKLVVILSPPNPDHMVRTDFDVSSTFDFEAGFAISKTENVIPMIFMFTKDERHQYICKLNFEHEDGSFLTREELDGIARTRMAVNRRR